MAASVCSGLFPICDQSSTVVTPALIAPSALTRSPMRTSSGRMSERMPSASRE
jgi:hypothetical protein